MKKNKIGRPPAKWMYELSQIDSISNETLDYNQLCELFGINLRTAIGFCSKLEIPGEYFKSETGIKKRFKVRDLKKYAKDHVSQ